MRNRAVVEQLRQEVDLLREKLKLLNDNLQMYKKYDGKDIELQSILQSVNHFIGNQSFNNPQFAELEQRNTDVELQNPF
jgi:hypothetical protein